MRARFALIIAFASLPLVAASRLEIEAQNTRLELRKQGFKTDLADFDFSTTPETQARVHHITNFAAASPYLMPVANNAGPVSLSELQPLIARDAAMILWQQPILPSTMRDDLWPPLRSLISTRKSDLAAIRKAIFEGPIAFNPNPRQGVGMLLVHLSRIKPVAQSLAGQALLHLRDGQTNDVWPNLLAATRLVTTWNPEPTDVSLAVHHACAEIVLDLSWQIFQARILSDAQLAELDREWSGVNFFRPIPETAAFLRASYVALVREQRNEPLPTNTISPREIIRAPRDALAALEHRRNMVNYRDYGTYEDERDLLLFYRDRENELRRAIASPTWDQMRRLPGVTNTQRFESAREGFNQIKCLMNMKELGIASMRGGGTTIGSAAQSEARRRILLTSIALERHRLARGAYPKNLAELANTPAQTRIDFMDGKPMRYRLTPDGHYTLYSVGLDCIDNEGAANFAKTPPPMMPWYPTHMAALPQNTDIVWPRPATQQETERHLQKLRDTAKRRLNGLDEDDDDIPISREELRRMRPSLSSQSR